MLGLKTNTVELLPHDTQWEITAAETAALIRSVLGDVCIDCQHIGSTSVRQICAKPIIDIAAAVNELCDVKPYMSALEKNGIIYRKEEYNGQLLFIMGDLDNDIRTHHIHIVKAASREWRDYLNFRDYLNAFPDKAREYEELKLGLRDKYPNDRGSYTSGKSVMISKLLSEAEEWRTSCVFR